jgi:hypothetical protein
MTSTDLNMEDGNSDNIAIINEMIDKFNKINHNPVKIFLSILKQT